MFQKILVPVDFTEKNVRAVKVALKLVSQQRGELTLLHVIEKVDHLAPAELKDFYGRLEKNVQSKMETFAGRFRKQGVPLVEEIIYGKPAQEIVKYAVKRKLDLIIVSSHKITAEMPQQKWGTLSYTIAVLSPCPVLLIK